MARNPVPHDNAFVSFEKKEIEQSIPERFEKQVKKYPERLAVKTKNTAFTYDTLNGFANRVARSILKGQADDQKEPCVLLLDQGIPLIAAILGTLKAGKIYLALDPHYPDKSNTDIVKVSGAQLIITDLKNLNRATRIAGNKVEILNVGELEESTGLVENPRLTILPKMPAYIFYTSGTTGQRKGVVDCHQNILHNIMRYTNSLGIHQHDKLTLIQSASFSGSVSSLFAALLNGACVFPIDLRQDGLKYLVDTMQKEDVTIFHSVPSLFRHVASEGKHFPTLRLIRLEGDQTTLKDVELYRKNFFDDCILVNGFGATECGIARQFFIDKNTTLNTNTVPVGFEVQDMETLILDDEGNLVAPNSVGELVIRSQYLASGYWKNDELTEKLFYGEDENGLRLYKTGDLARISEEGCLELMGRIDSQVKIRGYRVETADIEVVLSRHPGVSDCVVSTYEEATGEKYLVAYFVPSFNPLPSDQELRRFLKLELPEYYLPTRFNTIEQLPLTTNGKVDRQALSKLDALRHKLKYDFVAPRNSTEKVIAKIFAEVLDVEKVGVHDNFFELGGDSLRATQVVSRVAKIFNIQLPLNILFEVPTIQSLLEWYLANKIDSNHKIQTITKRKEFNNIPLSFSQERLWFINRLHPDSFAYNVITAFKLKGKLSEYALRKAFNAVVDRHEILHTSFILGNDGPVQLIKKENTSKLKVINLSDMSRENRDIQCEEVINEEAKRLFNLEQGPLFSCTLIKFENEEHILLLANHHIISDAWSMAVFFQEISACYEAIVKQTIPVLPELPIQYADYSIWQNEWMKSEELQHQLSYWKKQLQGAPPLLQLPIDYPRPAVQTFSGAVENIKLSHELTESLKNISRREHTTLFMTLLATYMVFLFRYTNQEDISVGIPIAGRTKTETEKLIGPIINTLVLRISHFSNKTFKELLNKVRQVTLKAYENQDLPFEKLVDELQPERNLSYTPLFQTMFNFQNVPDKPKQMNGVILEHYEIKRITSKFDLTLDITVVDESLSILFEYNTDIFRPETIKRMLCHFQNLLKGVSSNLNECISSLSLLTDKERHKILMDFNDTKKEYPDDLCVHQVFENQAEKTPDAIALIYKDVSLTYKELNEKANQLAHYLKKNRVGPEVLVAICMERCPEMVVGILGVLKAGGAYVPLDPSYPKERHAFMLKDTGTPVLLSQKRLLSVIPTGETKVISLDTEWETISRYASTNLSVSVDPENLAYVIHTSGSTGTPKGVEVPHRGVLRLLFGVDYVPLNAEQTFLQLATISFDASTFEIWGALLHGAKLVFFPDIFPTPSDLGRIINEQGVNILHLTTSLFNSIIDEMPDTLSGIKHLLIGGEALSVDHVRRALEFLPSTKFINGYGPTESTTFTCCYPIPRDLNKESTSIPIGRPIGNTQVYILDPHKNLIPVGVHGELHTSGAGLARGYLNSPEMTKEKFVPNPFSKDPKDRLYKTGDYVRYLPDGNIEFLGRIDNQVKIRGFRIELGEIEVALSQYLDVRETVVLAREDIPGNKCLVAYIVLNGEVTPTISELRSFLKEKLPNYMVPSSFVFLEELPLTPNGKIDRKALPAPDLAIQAEQQAPRTETEHLLCNLWSQVLGIEVTSILSHFFEAGGHSLLATQLVSRIRESLGIEMPLRVIFEQALLQEQAEWLDKQQRGSELPPIMPLAEGEPLVWSFAQQRLWFLTQLEGQSATYNMPAALRLTGRLNETALQRALTTLVERHDSLRYCFPLINGEATVQLNEVYNPLSFTDLRELSETEQQRQVTEWISKHAQTQFDLSTGPLLSLRLLKLGEQEQILLFNIHHIVSDGWSISIFEKELAELYLAFLNEESSPLPELPIQYVDFSIWQRHWLQGEVLEKQLSFWKKQLRGAPPVLELPTDRPRPSVRTYRGAQQSLVLPKTLSEALNVLRRQEGVTLFMTLLAAFQTILYRYAGHDDIVVGSPIDGRNRAETEGLIGLFVNMLVMRTDMSGNPTFRELLRRVQKVAVGVYAHQDLPFEKLVEEIHPERSMSYDPLFQVMFSLLNMPTSSLGLAGLTLSEVEEVDTGTARYDLSLSLAEKEGGLSGRLEYSKDLFDDATITRMLGHFQTLLEGIVSNPGQRISDLPLLTETERHQLLVEWVNTQSDYPKEECIHEVFEARVMRAPNAIAVVFEDQQLTYIELNARANQLAHYLRKRGVKPEVLVGIFMERSLEMVIGLLGILKAGGAYVPLDLAYPKERLTLILEDSVVPVLLTQEQLLGKLPEHGAKVVCLDTDWEEIGIESEENPSCVTMTDNLAYVIFTSGSTGRPKGVQIQQKALLTNLLTAMRLQPGLTEQDILLAITTLSFDISALELFLPLMVGARVVVVSREEATNGIQLLDRLTYSGATVMQATPATLRLLLESGWEGSPGLKVLCGGEALPKKLATQLVALCKSLWNMYGPTETTIWSLTIQIQLEDEVISIGRPIGNTQPYILDSHLNPVPIGITGEMHIGGDGLAMGYLNRPELTAEKFISNPFSNEPGARLYKTGDLTRYLPDGKIEFLGRIDNQVKIRGFRIELGEIEVVLGQHPAVRETAALAWEDVPENKRLVSYVVPSGEVTPTISELRSFLKEKLPDYMVPSSFVFLEELPLTPNGKVDRQALPPPDRARPELNETFIEPHTPMESLIAEIWQELLDVDRVGVYDNFFDLGGHSLLSMQVVSKLEKKLGLRVNPRELILQTLGQLASALEERKPVLIKSKPMNLTQRLKSAFKETLFFGRVDRK